MKKQILLLFILFNFKLFAQSSGFGASGSCNINVHDPRYQNNLRSPVIDATFMWIIGDGGQCSATLVNRNTSDDQVGFYFVTARHCVTAGGLAQELDPTSPAIDFSLNQYLIFNYQSPDANNSDVPQTNSGIGCFYQSGGTTYQNPNQTSLYPSNSNFPYFSNGYEYQHISKVRLVNRFYWGDFALCEILTPLPPHFNVTYAGWNPSPFSQVALTNSPFLLPSSYVNPSHPSEDIKKINGTNDVLWLQTPIATDCYAITTIIDAFLSIFDVSISTQVICNYVDNPWLTVPYIEYGANQQGSSGSGIFNANNRLIGQCSGVGGACGFPFILEFGKFSSNYHNSSIMNTLNPSNDLSVNLTGMGSRKISCYPNLILPGATGVSGEYFPAEDYQSNNNITLQANGTIQTTQPINIYPNANYTFKAGISITLGNGFVAHAGSTFTAKIQGCTESAVKKSPTIYDRLAQITLPKRQEFDINTYITEEEQKKVSALFTLYPNPSTGQCTVKFAIPLGTNVIITLTDMTGRDIATIDQSWHNQGTSLVPFSTESYAPGMYLVRFSDGTNTSTQRLVIGGK